jgi:phenylacetate-coenzyme A ligase PaaK-like adenylate-forming protein
MAVNRSPTAALAARQAARLRQVVAAAQQGSRLYAQRLRGVDAGTCSMSALPPVTRAELMERFTDWVGDPLLDPSALRDFMARSDACGSAFCDHYMVWESSGTSGLPGVFVQDAQSMAVYDVLEALRRSSPRPLARCMDPFYSTERIAFVGATEGHFASHVSLERMRRRNPWLAGATHAFSIQQPLDALVEALNAFAPTVLATYPTAAALLADAAQQGRWHANVREVWTGGEGLTAGVRTHVEQALDCPVRHSYGASEFLAMGWECSHGRMHVNADWVILEPVDASNEPVAPGVLSHHLLLTHLANTVQPLIRYELGDQIRMGTEPCPCGSPLPVIEVQGRRDDVLVLRGRSGVSVTLLPLALTTVLEEDAGVFDFQLRQTGAHAVSLRLGLRGHAAADAMGRCSTVLRAFARSHGIADLQVTLEVDQPLLRGRSGKVRRVMAAPTAA